MKRILFSALALFLFSFAQAFAASTTFLNLPAGTGSACTWTSAGAGPLRVRYPRTDGPRVEFAISDSAPSTAGQYFPVTPGAVTDITGTNQIWFCDYGAATTLTIAPGAGGSSSSPTVTTPAGSTGTDGSANAATVPISGYSLLSTIAANSARNYVEVQNQSASQVQVVRDDGLGNNQTSILLSSGSAANSQGGGWSSNTFKGRLRIYGLSGSQVAAYQD